MERIMRRFGKTSLWLLTLFFIGTVLIYRKLDVEDGENMRGHLIWTDFLVKKTNNHTCQMKHFEMGIDKLHSNTRTLHSLSNSECSSVYKAFSAMYEVDVFNATQRFNEDFSKKMTAWLGDKRTLDLAAFQTVYMVHDTLMQRTTVFNPLRSKRPVSKSQNSVISYLKNISDSSKVNCDFCKPFNATAEDIFGRIQGKHSVSASNAFKLAKWHGLFIPYEHSIFNIDIQIFLDMFNTSLKWFKKVHSIDGNAKYPVFFWDMFPHAGASQMHVHAHGILGEGHYPGEFEDVINAVRAFQHKHNAHYWDAVVQVYETFDLALRYGNTIIISPLVPRREHELWLLSNEPSSEFFALLYNIIKMYQDKMEKYCFSLAGALPALGEKVSDPEESLPSVVYIGTRGDCSSAVNDVSSLELYLFNNINTDPYKTIMTLREYLKTFPSKYGNLEELISLWNNSSKS
ncbi:hypothetical protein R5R35_000594 [Gryllus longicercus]|uniref:Uncharacterized protein n=1 Tax=Gryllus longicercus TaxID=2509291 RepID=A0AAN9VPM9_9ORTH